MRKKARDSVIVLLVLIGLMLSQGTAFAAYNTRPDKMYPQLQEAQIVSGYSPDAEIHLKFSNNVGSIDEHMEGRYDMTGINAANLTRFSVVSATYGDAPVSFVVTPHPDAAMHTEESKYFFIYANDLDINKEYIIKVDENLYANMGNSLAVDYEVPFTIATGEIEIVPMGELPPETAVLPLYFVRANIATNATGVELNPTIVMTFAYNVSGPEVLEYNKTCISLMKGFESVPIDIDTGDEVKEIVITPREPLLPFTEYRIVVTNDLMARNGSMLSSPVNLYFTTGDANSRGNGTGGDTSGSSGSSTAAPGTGGTPQQEVLGEPYFSDTKGSWALADINWLADRGILSGNPDGLFWPENTITRAEAVAILARAFDLSGGETSAFRDVDNHWARDYISAATSQGIVSGVGDGLFMPDAIVTREQLAVMIVRAGKLGAGGKAAAAFIDSGRISPWAREAVKIASTNGIISGYPDETFRPGQNVTRAEACHMIAGLLKLKK